MDFKKRKVEENGAGNVVEVTKEDVKKLIEPFNKEQIVEILQDAATRHTDVLEGIRKLADRDPAHRKVFVRGLGWELTADRLLAMFSQFGEIEEGPLGFDKFTGRSRGFALIIYKSSESAKRSLQEPIKSIDGHQMYCKLAVEGQKQRIGGTIGLPGKIDAGDVSKNGLQLSSAQSTLGLVSSGGGNLQYGSTHGLLSSGLALNHGLSAGVNQGLSQLSGGLNQGITQGLNQMLHSSLGQNQTFTSLAQPLGQGHQGVGSALNTGLTHSLNSFSNTHSQGLSQGVTHGIGQGLHQVQTSLAMGSYGSHVGISAYGSQPSVYSGQPAAYTNMGAMSLYGAGSSPVNQAVALQNVAAGGQYQFAPYANSQLAVPSTSRAHSVASLTHLPSSYYNI